MTSWLRCTYISHISLRKECVAVLIGLYKKKWCSFMCWKSFSLDLVTLPCQNLACSGPICTKRKTLFQVAKIYENTLSITHLNWIWLWADINRNCNTFFHKTLCQPFYAIVFLNFSFRSTHSQRVITHVILNYALVYCSIHITQVHNKLKYSSMTQL